MDVVFSLQPIRFVVFRDTDGTLHWSDFEDKKVSAAFPTADGSRCIILLHPEASRKREFENLFCLDRDGKTVWVGELPDMSDRFIEAYMETDGLYAWSWSCYWTVFDTKDGHVIRRQFTK